VEAWRARRVRRNLAPSVGDRLARVRREFLERPGLAQPLALARFVDLATVLPALFPATENDSLDDWVAHFGLSPIGRHHAIADAYATAQLLMIVLEAAPGFGIETAADLRDAEQAQRWLGRRR